MYHHRWELSDQTTKAMKTCTHSGAPQAPNLYAMIVTEVGEHGGSVLLDTYHKYKISFLTKIKGVQHRL